jgi:hypothetical protein
LPINQRSPFFSFLAIVIYSPGSASRYTDASQSMATSLID